MTETLLATLYRQAALLSLGATLLIALRPVLLARASARATYAAWLLLPALLATPLLPRLSHAPAPVLAQWSDAVQTAAAPLLAQSADGAWWPPALLAAWLGGTTCVLAWQAGRQWRLARRGSVLPAGSSPALVGLLRPVVALPADFDTRFTAEGRRLILAHEDIHRARHDNVWNLLACLLTALHWWNPLAWLAARRMQADQELACDAVVLARHPGARTAYTQALLAAHGLVSPQAPLASRWGSTHPLVERIGMLNRTGLLPRRRAGLLALCGAAAVGVAYAVQASPAAAIPAEGYVRLSLSLSFQEGMTIHRTNINLIGRSGEPMRIAMRPQMSGAPDLAINLKATALDDDQFRLDVTPEGLPPTHTGSRGMTARWGDAATLDSFDAAENTRFTVFAVGTRSAGPLPGRLQ